MTNASHSEVCACVKNWYPAYPFLKFCFFRWKYAQKCISVRSIALPVHQSIGFQRAPGLRSLTAFNRKSWPKLFCAQFIWGRRKWSIHLPLRSSVSTMCLNQVGCHSRSCHRGYDIRWLKQPGAMDARQIAFDTQGRLQPMCLLSQILCV